MAEPVSVNRGEGLGYVFSHNGNCFLILPAHVHGRSGRVSISTTLPTTVGDATLVRSFAPELDLSLFYVASGLERRCQDRFAALPEEVGPLLDGAGLAQLVRVDATGSETRDEMVITAVDFETIATTTSQTEIYQGTSGGILRVGDVPVGMAIQSEGTGQATFLRMDEIVARIRRVVTPDRIPVAAAPSGEQPAAPGACPASTIPIASIACSVEPSAPDFACSNLLTTPGATAAFPAGTAPRLEIELDVSEPVPLRSVELVSAAGDGFAAPQQIAVETSSGGTPTRWVRFGSRDMPPTGQVTITNGAMPYARRVAITMASSWNGELPTALTCLSLK